ncbi:MAG: uracil-DNA glycosylase family protein [Trinickia sp.]
MPLDEAALETLGLGTLWVRRGPPVDGARAKDEKVRAVSSEALRADAPEPMPTPRPERMSAPRDRAPAREAAQTMRRVEPPPASPEQRAAEPTVDEPAWDDIPHAAPAQSDRMAEPVFANDEREATGVAALDWDALESRVSACERCRLCEKRTNTVFGVGDRAADWMLIGEAPGENEDKQGEPFVGQAGKLLDGMLRALSLARGENVYIANVVKCRPPGNRNPEPDEVARCEPYLQRQVALVKPKLIVALGRVAAQSLLKTDESISSLRGRVHRYEDVPVIVTYHPAYLLRSLHDKAKAWVDLCLADDTYRQAVAQEQERR